MYIDSLKLRNFRTFKQASIEFLHSGRDFGRLEMPRPRYPNINLILGNNGLGKSALLKAVALAALGPAVRDSGIFPYRLVRREPRSSRYPQSTRATLAATFTTHRQDGVTAGGQLASAVRILRKEDLEVLSSTTPTEKDWDPIFSESSDAFFFVGYGSTRRVERPNRLDLGSRSSSAFARAQRVQGLFEESYSLVPLTAWLPQLEAKNRGRYRQVLNLINRLLGDDRYSFEGELENDEYLFVQGELRVPFPALSDGYRAYLGWIGDLLYHVVQTCPSGKKLVDNQGIVMVDEIDLHLHPSWQRDLLPTLSAALPNLQFIVTSHSPLLVSSLEWMNILVMEPGPSQTCTPRRFAAPVHGLDADQVLVSEFFGLDSTRSQPRSRELKELTLKAGEGDPAAALELLQALGAGAEKSA